VCEISPKCEKEKKEYYDTPFFGIKKKITTIEL